MEPRNHTNDRRLTDPVSCRLWEDNYECVKKISEETGRPYREVLRDIVDEALQARLNPPTDLGAGEITRNLELLIEQNRMANERYEKLVERYEQLAEREAKLKQGLVAQLRDFAGILGEVLAAAIGARRLAWNYIAYEALKGSKYSDSQIKERWEAENKAWNAERDETISEVKRIIRGKWPAPE
ncbi:MAG: hypothetical protein MOB07_13075 [Acidobacteria bacterium]|nr:hypothetical protein [Acidobacteriota bacterium]